jgi:hypothetical protein
VPVGLFGKCSSSTLYFMTTQEKPEENLDMGFVTQFDNSFDWKKISWDNPFNYLKPDFFTVS